MSCFRREGIKVILLGKMHQKIAVIDRRITWEGSLNILSHNTTQEHMRRFVGPKTAEQIIRNYGLDAEPATRGARSPLPGMRQEGPGGQPRSQAGPVRLFSKLSQLPPLQLQ